MKKIVFILLVLISIACSKKDPEPEPTVTYSPEEQAKIDFQKQLPTGVELVYFLPYHSGTYFGIAKKNTEFYFYELKNNKIITQYKETLPEKIEYPLPYGEKDVFNVSECEVRLIEGSSEDNIILFGLFKKDEYYRNVYFPYVWVYYNNKFKHLETKKERIHNSKVSKWGDFGFLLSTYPYDDSKSYSIMYDTNWDYLYKTEYDKEKYGGEIIPLNTEEIIICTYNGNSFLRINVRTLNTLWKIEDIYKTLPKNVRIDKKDITKDGELWTIKTSYTLYSGQKDELITKINIKEGKIVN
jgi:hypothetical protein